MDDDKTDGDLVNVVESKFYLGGYTVYIGLLVPISISENDLTPEIIASVRVILTGVAHRTTGSTRCDPLGILDAFIVKRGEYPESFQVFPNLEPLLMLVENRVMSPNNDNWSILDAIQAHSDNLSSKLDSLDMLPAVKRMDADQRREFFLSIGKNPRKTCRVINGDLNITLPDLGDGEVRTITLDAGQWSWLPTLKNPIKLINS